MKRIKLFEEFIQINKNTMLIESMLDGNYINLNFINEASISDFKPSLEMAKWAIGDEGMTSANDYIKFASAVAQQWDDLEDEKKENALSKWNTMKGTFKREVAKVRAAAEKGDGKAETVTRQILKLTPKAKEVYASKIEPLYAGGGESTSKDEEKIKAEIEKVKAELEKAEDAFAKARKDYDDGKIKWDEVQPLVKPKMDLEAKLINLEGQIDDDAKEDVKDLKKLQAEYAAAQAEFAKARKDYDDGKIKWNEVAPYVDKMLNIEAEIAALA